eukprot:scaffold48423_cov69-Phaeocystis_antarctica.AAC.1
MRPRKRQTPWCPCPGLRVVRNESQAYSGSTSGRCHGSCAHRRGETRPPHNPGIEIIEGVAIPKVLGCEVQDWLVGDGLVALGEAVGHRWVRGSGPEHSTSGASGVDANPWADASSEASSVANLVQVRAQLATLTCSLL